MVMNRFHQEGTNLYLVSGIGFIRYLHCLKRFF